jgi:hypothetical protein
MKDIAMNTANAKQRRTSERKRQEKRRRRRKGNVFLAAWG